MLTSPRNSSDYANNPVGLVLRRGVFGNATGGVRVCPKCSRMGRWVIAQFSRGHSLEGVGEGEPVILHHPNVTDVRTAAPDRSVQLSLSLRRCQLHRI